MREMAIGLVLAGIVICVFLLAGPAFLGYRKPGREPLQYRIERFDWYWVREHLRRDLVSYERGLVRDYANTGLLIQPALGEVQKALDSPETLGALQSTQAVRGGHAHKVGGPGSSMPPCLSYAL